MSLAVIILTLNEERHIARALNSVASLASELFVVDSFSTDRTVELAREQGATVVQNPFVNHAKQFQWALDNLPITADWIMRPDADEIVEADLARRLRDELPTLPPDVVGITLKLKIIFQGRWIRHGGRYPLLLLRIWRRGHGRMADRWMDEHMVVRGGRMITLEGGIADHNLNDLTFFTNKHNKYATREAIDVVNQRRNFFPRPAPSADQGQSSVQTALKLVIKEKVYNRIPYLVSAPAYFFYRVVFRLGFLDGKEGILYHCLQALWYRLLVGAKVAELERALVGIEDPAAIRAEIQRRTGFALDP